MYRHITKNTCLYGENPMSVCPLLEIEHNTMEAHEGIFQILAVKMLYELGYHGDDLSSHGNHPFD
jgi:hypothetical protein